MMVICFQCRAVDEYDIEQDNSKLPLENLKNFVD